MIAFYPRLRLSSKISVPFLLLYLCVCTIGTAVFGHWLSGGLEEVTRGKVEGLADLVLNNARREADRLRSDARLIADEAAVRTAVAEGDVQMLTRALLPAKAMTGANLLKVVDSRGNVLVDLRDQRLVGARLGDQSVIRQSLSGMSLNSLVFAEGRAATLIVGVAPIRSSQGLLGGIILGIAIDGNYLQKIGVERGEELVILSGQGIVASSTSGVRGEGWVPPEPDWPATRTTIGAQQYLAKRVDLNLDDSSADLTLVVLSPTDQLDNAKGLLWIRMSAYFLVGMLVTATIGSRIARMISRPLLDLTRLAGQLAGGNLEARATISSQDEVGELQRAFNSMGQQIGERNARLSSVLTELEQRQEELEAINRAATQLALLTESGEVLSTGLKLAREGTGQPCGAIWLLKSAMESRLVAHQEIAREDLPLLEALPRTHTKAWSRLLSCAPAVVCLQGAAEAGPAGGAPGAAASHLVLAPLVARGTVLGVIGLYGTDRGGSAEGHIQLAEAFGASIGLAIDNARRYEEARYLAEHDPVTGLLNHRAFHQRLSQEVKRAQRSNSELSVIMMDLDNFKLFNDTYGHPAGDHVLQEISSVLLKTARETDVLGRYGGDEFVALLPETGSTGALSLAQRLQSALSASPFLAKDGGAVPIKMSFGLATYPVEAKSVHELVHLADMNLYVSKRKGGDSIHGGPEQGVEIVDSSGAFGVMDGLVTAVDHKDHYTRRHSEDVTNYALLIAERLAFSEDSLRTLRIAGLLHDVGKIGVPDRILKKPGKLSEDEFAVISQHARLGEIIIKEVPNLAEVLSAVGSHHERMDGQGYPRGLQGEEIPLLGRILAVADAYSAMTSDRPYRKALSPEVAKKELVRVSGSQLDPTLVDLFLEALDRALATGRGAAPAYT